MQYLVGCSGKTSKQQDLVSYLDDLGQKYEYICVEMGTANWNLYSKEGEADQDTPKKKYAELLLDPEHMKVVDIWQDKIDKEANPRLFYKIARDLWRAQKGNSHILFSLYSFCLATNLTSWSAALPRLAYEEIWEEVTDAVFNRR